MIDLQQFCDPSGSIIKPLALDRPRLQHSAYNIPLTASATEET